MVTGDSTTPRKTRIKYCVPEIQGAAHRALVDRAFGPLRAVYTRRAGPPRAAWPGSRTVVAERGGGLVGAVSFYLTEQQVRLFAVAVDPDWRRRGIARALIEWIADNVCSETHPELGLYTVEETGNAAIFERLGFCIVSRRVAVDAVSPSGGPVHELDMVLRVIR